MSSALTSKPGCLSQIAYGKIKDMILQRVLIPGQFVNEAQLQELLGIGRTPVREAILALAQDKLVTIFPRKGIEIASPTLKGIHDVFEIRSMLEPMVLRKCFDMIDPQWAVNMRATLLQHDADSAGNAAETAAPLIDLDNRFHLELVDTLHNTYASGLIHSSVEYLNLIRVTFWQPVRYRESNREHIAILDAIINKEQEKACQMLSDHLMLSYQNAVNTMMHSSF